MRMVVVEAMETRSIHLHAVSLGKNKTHALISSVWCTRNSGDGVV
jgi:hypothetical protein